MRVIIAERGSGKTTKLIEWMLEAPEGEIRFYVGAYRSAAMNALGMYRAMVDDGRIVLKVGQPALATWQFISVGELKNRTLARHAGYHHQVFGFDDVDRVLREILAASGSLGFISITGTTETAITIPHLETKGF